MPPRSSSSSSSSNPSSSKKRKTAQDEADSNDPPPPPSPSTSFFFEDGNVLLHVEDTLFKVHRGVLQKAQVFADTLLVGSARPGEEIPTIKLTDQKDDWEVFLRAIYEGVTFSEKLPTLLETRSLLLLTDKYNHPSLLAWAKMSFYNRSRIEKSRFTTTAKDLAPHQHDTTSPPFSGRCLQALLSISEQFALDPSSVRWIYTRIATLPLDTRFAFLKSYNDVEQDSLSWQPSLSTTTLLAILHRVEQVSNIALRTLNSLAALQDNVHSPACPGTSSCRTAMEASVKKLLVAFNAAGISDAGGNCETFLARAVASFPVQAIGGSSTMDPYCRLKAQQEFVQLQIAYDRKMAEDFCV